jgi:hypothetical protein
VEHAGAIIKVMHDRSLEHEMKKGKLVFRHCERSEAIQLGAGGWIASSLRSSQ